MNPGVILLVLGCVIPVVLWATAEAVGPRFSGAAATLSSLGYIFGLAGVSAFALNLVLGARLKVADRLFGGLDKLFRVHRVNGRVAFLLLVAHAVAMLASRAVDSWSSVGALLDPNKGGWPVLLGVLALLLMSLSIYLTLYGGLNHELFVYVQRTFGFIFMIGLIHVFQMPGSRAASPALNYYLIGISAFGLIAFFRRSIASETLVPHYSYSVKAVNRLAEDVTEIVMSPEDQSLSFKAGQFVFLSFDSPAVHQVFHPVWVERGEREVVVGLRPGALGGEHQPHPFSITSAPNERDLRVTIKALGDFTRAVRQLEEGAGVRVEGPYGGFSHENIPNNRQIWIAGGIGITPFLSMARSLDADDYVVDLYWGTKRKNEAYFLDELQGIAARDPNFRVIHVPEEEMGFISADLIQEQSGDITGADVLICGPLVMMQALQKQCLDKGLPANRIHYEQFGFGA